MGKLIYAINLTLDGCCGHDQVAPDEEVFKYHTNLLREAGLLIFGRKTYELMVPYWPDTAKNHSGDESENEFAREFDSKKIVVFSGLLDRDERKRTRFVRGNLRDEVLKLKQETGKNILTGGVDIPSQLIGLGLVDEFHFVFQPNLAGKGRRLLDGIDLPEKLQLKRIGSKIFDSGAVALHYLKQ